MLGTFRYMSPEQASGRAVVLDQRTDIYSLGVTMYELLTLERALPGQTREELMYQITSVDPKPPRSIDRKIPVELENIIGKAMAKDAAERYPTAHAMAEDLQRFLEDKPVLARPPSLMNKAVKWSRRHKTVTVSGAVVLALAAAGSSVSSILIAHEQGRTKAAYLLEQRRAAEANQQRQRAVKNFDQARDAVDFLTSMAINELPTDPQFFQVRWRMLETSLAYYQSFLDQQKDDPSRAAQLQAAQAQVTAVLAELSAVDELVRKNFEIRLLLEPSVQSDIALTAQQTNAARSLVSNVAMKPPAQDDSEVHSTEQIRAMVSKDAAQRETALQAVVTPAQEKRLREISRQIRGAFAFSDADVAALMAFTSAQKDAIRSACAEFHNRHHHGPHGPGADSERADMADMLGRIREILSPKQLQTWELLCGKPYNGYAPPYEFWFGPQHRGPDGMEREPGDPGGARGGHDHQRGGPNEGRNGPPQLPREDTHRPDNRDPSRRPAGDERDGPGHGPDGPPPGRDDPDGLPGPDGPPSDRRPGRPPAVPEARINGDMSNIG
jgi:hypothetical protein